MSDENNEFVYFNNFRALNTESAYQYYEDDADEIVVKSILWTMVNCLQDAECAIKEGESLFEPIKEEISDLFIKMRDMEFPLDDEFGHNSIDTIDNLKNSSNILRNCSLKILDSAFTIKNQLLEINLLLNFLKRLEDIKSDSTSRLLLGNRREQ